MAQGTASLVTEAALAILIIVAFFAFVAPLFNEVETITPDTSIDFDSPEAVQITPYTDLAKYTPYLFMLVVVIAAYLYVMSHIGSEDNVQ